MKRYFLLVFIFPCLATFTLLDAEPFPIDFVTVGDAGNMADSVTHLGAVAVPYQIGKYEVTAAQYCLFLNAVASKEDPHGLYNSNMASDPKVACIERSTNSDGTFGYTTLPNTDQFPITYVGYNNSCRFCNWYQNGMPTSAQGDDVVATSTENGAYSFTQGENGGEQVSLSSNAVYTLATEDQWMKAAYYAGKGTNSCYWLYPTAHNTAPNVGATDVFNEANWDTSSYASYWSGLEARKNPVLTSVDLFSQTMSAYQACDMGGNVNEWMMRANEIDETAPSPITRGGSWASTYFAPNHWARTTNDLMRTAPAVAYGADSEIVTSTGSNAIGFRLVCSVVPPAPMAAGMERLGDTSTSNGGTILQQAAQQQTLTQWWNGLTWYEKAGIIAAAAAVLGLSAWGLWSLMGSGEAVLTGAGGGMEGGGDFLVGKQSVTRYDEFGNEIKASDPEAVQMSGRQKTYPLRKSRTRADIWEKEAND